MNVKLAIIAISAALAITAFDAPAFAHHKRTVINANGGNGGLCVLSNNGCNGGDGGTINGAGKAPKGSHINANGGDGGVSFGGSGNANGGNGGTINF